MVADRGIGTVLASFGRGALVQSGDDLLRCGLMGRKLRVVCGDRVAWVRSSSADGPSVESVQMRSNLVERIDARGRPEAVAANISQLAIVVAPEPQPDWFVVDRYWASTELKDLKAVLIVNKTDLDTASLRETLEEYRKLKLPILEIACNERRGIEHLKERLQGKTTLLVGQSGVGKSSLVNALAPHAEAQTSELTKDQEGRHTTTTARWYTLNESTAIIDAPGVRDFAPPNSLLRAAERGFVEVHEHSIGCRFKDCRHMEEPGCTVRIAVVNGLISPRRYESYRRLFRLYQKLAT
jgi:ribosome biogenesis GTPase / thiamine phosphate phosphatase